MKMDHVTAFQLAIETASIRSACTCTVLQRRFKNILKTLIFNSTFLFADPHERSKKVVATKDWESAAYKEHVESLPDIPTLEHYEAMPVDAFGEAMLRGMGWAGPSEQEVHYTPDF